MIGSGSQSDEVLDPDMEIGRLRTENANLQERNDALADACADSVSIIEELERTKLELATARQAAEEAHGSVKRMSETIFEGAHDAMLVLDNNKRLVSANKTAREMFAIDGLDSKVDFACEMLCLYRSLDHQDWFEAMMPDSPSRLHRIELYRYVSDPDGSVEENSDEFATSTRRWIELSISVLPYDQGQQYLVTAHEITKRKEVEKQVQYQAFHDKVTRLPNRRFFVHQVEELMANQAPDETFAICFLDLDNFKTVNDTLGHEAGDQLLIQVADRIQHTTRDDCFLARFGGDEFALLVPRLPAETVARIADRIVAALQQPFAINENSVYVGASIGMTQFPEDGTDVNDLLQNADVAMYSAKERGRNCFHAFTPELGARLRERQALLNDIRSVVERGRVSLEYQPKWNISEKRVSGCEALLRWQRDGKPIPAGYLVEVAECSGLIQPLGELVMQQAIDQMAQWRKQRIVDGTIAVNISPRQISSRTFVDKFQRMAEQFDIPLSAIELEITETAVLDNLGEAFHQLEKLKEIGVSIAIDDFGTGYSSLSYLKSFPVSTLKIDRSFVQDLPHDSKAVAITKTILELGHGLGLQVVAEGVETMEQYCFLEAAGCDQIQGYLVSRSLSVERFPEWAISTAREHNAWELH